MIKALKSLTFVAVTTIISLNGYAQQIDQTFSGIDKIEISTGSSDCIVHKGSGNDVNVKLVHDRGENFKPTVRQSGSKLVISENSQGKDQGKATWTLSIPNGLELDFNTGSGDFEASNLELELSLNAGSGDFTLHNLKGEIESNAGSGDLEVDTFSGKLQSNVGSGDLEVENADGDLALNAGSGDIQLSKINAEIDANVGSGDIGADQVILAGKSKFNSGSGDVQVSLNESLKHDISVNSGSGDATLDFNGSKIDGMVTMTANKRNGKISAPFAFDKEEEIDHGGDTTIKKTARVGTSAVEIKVGTGSGEASIMD
jgi:hypothetical protein